MARDAYCSRHVVPPSLTFVLVLRATFVCLFSASSCSSPVDCSTAPAGVAFQWQRVSVLGPFNASSTQCGVALSAAAVFAVVGCPGLNKVLVLQKQSPDGATTPWTVVTNLLLDQALAATGDSATVSDGSERFGTSVKLTTRHLIVRLL